MVRLWRNIEGTEEGKYLVLRRDGTTPEWPYFILSAADPAVPLALRTYAAECERLGFDPDYTSDIMGLASEFEQWRETNGTGNPDAPRHRTDDPVTVEKMRTRD